jgi:hypothetical protein
VEVSPRPANWPPRRSQVAIRASLLDYAESKATLDRLGAVQGPFTSIAVSLGVFSLYILIVRLAMTKNEIILEVLAVPCRAARARRRGGSTGARAKAWCFRIHAEASLSQRRLALLLVPVPAEYEVVKTKVQATWTHPWRPPERCFRRGFGKLIYCFIRAYFLKCVFLTTPPLTGQNEAPPKNPPGDLKPAN